MTTFERLIPVKRGQGRLGEAAARDALAESESTALPASTNASGDGVAWPLTEVGRTTQTLRIYDPHDATRYVDVEQATQVDFQDANGTTGSIILTP